MANRQISPERKTLYYVGMVISILGFLCFISTFFSAASHFGDFSNFEGRARSFSGRAIAGMLMLIAGQFIMRVGRSGLAGSGVKLDPQEARRDVEPWSRMTGGVLKDTLDEAGINLSGGSGEQKLSFDERLRRLQKLRDDGIVNEEEYQATKKKILEGA